MKIVKSSRVQGSRFKVQSFSPSILQSFNKKGLTVFSLSAFLLFCISALNAQTNDYNYNPYEYAQEELFLTSLGVREIYESTDCASANDYIRKFNNAAVRGEDKEKQNAMRAISFFQCKESYTFFEDLIKKNASVSDRCQALMFLARMMNPESLPLILEYAKKPSLSIHEKAAIATALTVLRSYNLTVLTDQSITILDEICYDAPTDVLAICILNYFNIKGDAAIKFFNSQLKQKEFELYAALFLAKLGETTNTFPIFAANLSSDNEYEVHTAVMGLAAIGTDEATALILNLPPQKNRLTHRERLINFNLMDLKKGDKQ